MAQNNQFERRNIHPFPKLILTILTIIVAGVVFQLIGALTATAVFDISLVEILNFQGSISADHIAALKWLQIIGALGAFVFASFLLSYIYTGSWTGYFHFGKRLDWIAVAIIIMVMLAALPFVNWLTEVNTNIEIPFEKLEAYFRTMHEQTESLMMTLVRADNFWGLLLNLFMIALIPAIGEELVFRGLIQDHFQAWFRNGHLAIFLTAVIFSLVHFQIYSFLPRFFLGIILGYMMYYGRSIWFPMIGHFVNNSMGVLYYYFQQDIESSGTLDDIGTSELYPVFAILSILFTGALMYMWVKRLKSNQSPQSD